jgi:hypothetical protein
VPVEQIVDYETDLDDADHILAAIESLLLRRERELWISDNDVYRVDGPLELRGRSSIESLGRSSSNSSRERLSRRAGSLLCTTRTIRSRAQSRLSSI